MLALLTKLIGGKVRLVVEYALIAAVVAVSGATFVLWSQNTAMHERMLQFREDIVSYRREVNELKELRTADAKSLTSLLADMKIISQHDAAMKLKLAELEKSNDNVRLFLETSLPLELVCMLNDTCARDDRFVQRKPPGRPD